MCDSTEPTKAIELYTAASELNEVSVEALHFYKDS